MAVQASWSRQKRRLSLPLAEVLDSTPGNVLMHLRNIFVSGELEADATTKEFVAVRADRRSIHEKDAACRHRARSG